MTYCVKCGELLPEGAQFCPKCGTSVLGSLTAERKDYSGVGGALILIGGILAVVLSIISLVSTLFLRRAIEQIGRLDIWSRLGMEGLSIPLVTRWIVGLITIEAIVAIVLGIVAFYAYTRVKAGEFKSGGLVAIIAAVIMLATTHWIPGIVTLVGGILCYTSERPATQQPTK